MTTSTEESQYVQIIARVFSKHCIAGADQFEFPRSAITDAAEELGLPRRFGVQYILPVQAKGGSDMLGRIQVEQDIAMCKAKFPQLVMRPIAAQFMANGTIALFEVTIHEDAMVVVRESHYQLVPFEEITPEDRRTFQSQAGLPPPLPTVSY